MKKNYVIRLFVLLLLFCVGVDKLASQDFNQRYYYDSPLWQDFREVIPLNDTSFAVVTQSWAPAALDGYQTQIAIVNAKGELLTPSNIIQNVLSNFMTAGDICLDSDGELIISGSILANNMVLKILAGNINWDYVLNLGALTNSVNDFIQQSSTGNFITAGHRVSGDYGFITEISSSGQTDTVYKINASDSLCSIKSLQVYPSNTNGFYILINQDRTDLTTFNQSFYNVMRLNDDLSISWNRSYSVQDSNEFSEVYGFIESDTGFSTVGRHNDNTIFTQYDLSGNVVNTKEYIVGANELAGWGSGIILDSMGGYLLTTGVPSPSSSVNYQSLLMNINGTGDINWVRRYNPGADASFKGIQWHNENLIAYGRVVTNGVNEAFWLNTYIGYEDCSYEIITPSVNAITATTIDNPLATIPASINPFQAGNPFLMIADDATPLDSSCTFINDVVYPGDANFNQVANIYDVLPIGVHYGSNGESRPNATNDWIGQWAPDWLINQVDGTDIKHVDSNGDGVIDMDDVTPLIDNYDLMHNSSGRSREVFSRMDGPELYVDLPNSASQGIQFASDVIFGTTANPAEDIYGVCFVVDYAASPIPISDISFVGNPSWFGSMDSVIVVTNHDSIAQKLEIGIVKNTGINHERGIGPIGQVYIVTEDNVLDRIIANEIILEIKDVKAISVDETILPVDPQIREVVITSYRDNLLNDHFNVYPNPSSEYIVVKGLTKSTDLIKQISLVNTSGQFIDNLAVQERIPIHQYKPGIYWLKIEHQDGIGYYKLIIQ